MTIGEFLRAKRHSRGLSARELAERAGITDAHLIYLEKGQRRPTFDILSNVLAALGVDFGTFLEATGYARGAEGGMVEKGAGQRRIPVVTWVIAGSWREVCDSFEPGDADLWITSDVKGPNVFALRVSGDSMEPEFTEGEIITVNPHLEPMAQDFVIVKNPEGEATFKQLRKQGERWLLHPLNPRYEDIELAGGEYMMIGKVVKKEKRY